jgi:hypothetical protein
MAAFNPFKKIPEIPLEENQEIITSDEKEKTFQNLSSLDFQEQENDELENNFIDSYEGEPLSELEFSGLQTISLLKVASSHVSEKKKFNISLLDNIPLAVVLDFFKAENKSNKNYIVFNQEISIKENKWYNITHKKGNIKAISLMKHLVSIHEKIDPEENDKLLFLNACKKLNQIQENLEKNNIIEEQETKTNTITTPKKLENKIDWKALTEQLNNIPINLVLEHIGAHPNEDNQRGKWKVWKTGHNLGVTGQQWNDWNTQVGGFGGISLLAYHLSFDLNISYKDDQDRKYLRTLAIKELMKVFGSDYDLQNFAINDSSKEYHYKEPFSMPLILDAKMNDVKKYLHEKRGLPLWIIQKQINSGLLFAGFPSDWKQQDKNIHNQEKLSNDKVWAVFLAINSNAAELRAIERTDEYAKMLAKGSDKELGGFLVKAEKSMHEKTVVSLEAAIDSMSYHAIYPGRITMSCMGVNFNLAVISAVEALSNDFRYILAFDNDLAGNEAAYHFKNQLIEQIGEEEYKNYYSENKIKYFELGIQCLEKSIANNQIFYLDVKNNDTGKEVVKMFQEELLKSFSKESIKKWIQDGKIKYINLQPSFEIMQNPAKEAENIAQLLMSNKPYYLVLKEEDLQPQFQMKKELFEKHLFDYLQTHKELFEKDGRIIYQKKSLFKDWNEYYLFMQKNPEFQNQQKAFEEQFSFYRQDKNIKKILNHK